MMSTLQCLEGLSAEGPGQVTWVAECHPGTPYVALAP